MKKLRTVLAIGVLATMSLSATPAAAMPNEELCRYLAGCGSLDCKFMEWILC